jgi:hypothetical protein
VEARFTASRGGHSVKGERHVRAHRLAQPLILCAANGRF